MHSVLHPAQQNLPLVPAVIKAHTLTNLEEGRKAEQYREEEAIHFSIRVIATALYVALFLKEGLGEETCQSLCLPYCVSV